MARKDSASIAWSLGVRIVNGLSRSMDSTDEQSQHRTRTLEALQGAKASKREGDLLDASTTWVGERLPFGSLPRFSKDILNQETSGIRGDTWTGELSGKSAPRRIRRGFTISQQRIQPFHGVHEFGPGPSESTQPGPCTATPHRKSLPAVSERRGEVAA